MSSSSEFNKLTWSDFKWLNKPNTWHLNGDNLEIITDYETDFWQTTYYGFKFNSGHVYGVDLKGDFTFTACIEADFKTLYDQAGLMIYVDEKHWLKTGIEHNDDRPMISSVLTNENSDWATGVFNGDSRKFWMRLTKSGDVVCVKYSADNITWNLLRLCPFVRAEQYFVGVMTCTPKSGDLKVKFSGMSISQPAKDILHSN